MFSIQNCPVPPKTLLEKYSTDGGYIDCYSTEVPGQVALSEFIFAFYRTILFRLERFLLTWIVSKPSTDKQVRQLSRGEIEIFAAWHVENRNEHELLLCDFPGRTRSWLMAVPVQTIRGSQTRLYFGSAVVPVRNVKTGKLSLGWGYQALLGFHRIYSVLLLYFAKARILEKQAKQGESFCH